jgi:dihydroorotate dehydrogenase (NAD+) catalytic subunit
LSPLDVIEGIKNHLDAKSLKHFEELIGRAHRLDIKQ